LHVHFLAAGTSAARMRVQVRDGGQIGRKTHDLKRGGSEIGRQAHEVHRGAGAAVPGLHEYRTSDSEKFRDGWAQKISRVPTPEKIA
jgi:hypothetical protein